MLWYESWHTNTQVHVEAILDLLRSSFSNLVSKSLSCSLLRTEVRRFFAVRSECEDFNAGWYVRLHDAVDVDSRKVDGVGRKLAYGNNILSLNKFNKRPEIRESIIL
jgi:hypothetical protein